MPPIVTIQLSLIYVSLGAVIAVFPVSYIWDKVTFETHIDEASTSLLFSTLSHKWAPLFSTSGRNCRVLLLYFSILSLVFFIHLYCSFRVLFLLFFLCCSPTYILFLLFLLCYSPIHSLFLLIMLFFVYIFLEIWMSFYLDI